MPTDPSPPSSRARSPAATMKSASLLLLLFSSVLLPPAASRGRPLHDNSLQSGQALLRAASAGDSTAARLLGFSLHKPFLRKEDYDDNDVEAEEGQLQKRNEDAPISIDLTFHLLRNMIHLARTEKQRQRAHFNRKVLDEVGK
ncbi:UI-like isoform X1 [Entelurus aequoreus]|uniref:UI-like n=2 Tax=Entelurus aequoreus TaxID=161455 RepID=UPI002B1D61FA|nr:UI-like [Entelurus aequoreus]XP_061900830.1 UI-like isoform X1 [Entelurus aequoreus]